MPRLCFSIAVQDDLSLPALALTTDVPLFCLLNFRYRNLFLSLYQVEFLTCPYLLFSHLMRSPVLLGQCLSKHSMAPNHNQIMSANSLFLTRHNYSFSVKIRTQKLTVLFKFQADVESSLGTYIRQESRIEISGLQLGVQL